LCRSTKTTAQIGRMAFAKAGKNTGGEAGGKDLREKNCLSRAAHQTAE